MTSGDKSMKRAARELAQRTGRSYTSARNQILRTRRLTYAETPSATSPRVFSIVHGKGGIGVSTLAAGLVDAWARAGHRVR